MNEHQILEETQISKQTQITNKPQILKGHKISKQTQIMKEPKILKFGKKFLSKLKLQTNNKF